jgi:hypothetical protein
MSSQEMKTFPRTTITIIIIAAVIVIAVAIAAGVTEKSLFCIPVFFLPPVLHPTRRFVVGLQCTVSPEWFQSNVERSSLTPLLRRPPRGSSPRFRICKFSISHSFTCNGQLAVRKQNQALTRDSFFAFFFWIFGLMF